MSAKKQEPVKIPEPKYSEIQYPAGPVSYNVGFKADRPSLGSSVKARVVSHSRDYLTLEFIGSEPKQFDIGQVVSVSKE